MKFLVGMNLSPLWVPFLNSHGFEAVHWSTIGQPSAPNPEILDFAASNSWIVFTHDLDFGRYSRVAGRTVPALFRSVRKTSFHPPSVKVCSARFELPKGI